jgi:hypothetical protein
MGGVASVAECGWAGVAPVAEDLPSVPAAGSQRYAVQFTATAEHVALVERAQALLSSSREGASVAEVHLRAMRELVAALEKRKYGVGARPRGSRKSTTNAATERQSTVSVEADSVAAPAEASSSVPVSAGTCTTAPSGIGERTGGGETGEQRKVGHAGGAPREAGERREATQSGEGLASDDGEGRDDDTARAADARDTDPELGKSPRQRGRYVPAAVRREVFERDAGRCGYVDSCGRRCRETRWLELHHLQAFALDGEHSVANLALRCRAHNALAAEDDFGREFAREKRGSIRHESFASAARGQSDASRGR